jgi:quercetin dioxygenase-like cupin family protein
MKKVTAFGILGICVMAVAFLEAQENQPLKSPTSFALDCPGGDCPLLKGAPQTGGMRGGSVKLKPGESAGWHSTNQNEEALVILDGHGIANRGRSQPSPA